ncbi:glycosyltransferase [Microbacterium sp.]|uniref:glycosyltransferase n=1 Tax=Microbacterium sp. TaxID=51671 RepID=UPI00261D8233|nr:glycosyltransferase [Microbacterium sp.]
MKICVIGKYPPIEGGVSAETYWMCRALAERGHDVTVVTNAAEVDEDYRIELDLADLGELNRTFANGGRLRVSWTSPWSEREWHHVPTGNPTHSRLVSLALQVVAEHQSELILSHYLEPYGVAASMVGDLTGVPWVVRHAGSDRFRLMRNPELGTVYKATFRGADGVMFSGTDLLGLGVDPQRVIDMPSRNFMPPSFSEHTPPMDLVAAFNSPLARSSNRFIRPGPLVPGKPIVGMYGKIGEQKGTFDLLRAYSASEFLRDATQLVLLGGGANTGLLRETISDLGLSSHVWLHPFVAHWRVPAFLRSCRVVCLLEREFDVAQHGPGLLKETLACAVPTFVSAEVYEKILPDLDEQQIEELLHVVPARSESRTLASALEETLKNSDQTTAPMWRRDLIDRAQLSRDYDDLADELVKRFGASVPKTKADLRPPSREPALAPIMEMISSIAPLLSRKYTAELYQQIFDGLMALPVDSPAIAAAVPAVETILARAAEPGGESLNPASVHELAVMRLEADLLWGAIEPFENSFTDAFPAFLGQIAQASILAPTFARHRDSLRRCWERSVRLRFRELPVSVLSYLESRRNRVDMATREPYDSGGDSEPCDPDETRLFLIAQRADLDTSVIEVSEAVRTLIHCCDGVRTTEEVASELRRSHPSVSMSLVETWLRGLQDHDVVREAWVHQAWRETAPYLTKEA